jgi:putative Mn2+ efflux pump MntP
MVNISAIAVALAMDAFAVAIATGVTLKSVSFRQTFRLSWHFGLFQALMPVIGWGAGATVRVYIQAYSHWIAFGLLSLIGLKMIAEAFKHDGTRQKKDPTKGMMLVVLSVATSIDALAVGLSISMLNVGIWLPACVIGLVAGGFTVVGLQFGRRMGSAAKLGLYAEVFGGVVLIVIGLNILRGHGAL